VLVGHLKPARVYWYRFTDGEGNGSRVGRAMTPPLMNDHGRSISVDTAPLRKPGERPVLRQHVVEGDPGLSI